MAFTGVLGSPDANLGNFALGQVATNSGLNQSVHHTLTMSQGIVVGHTSNVAASNTLSLSSSAVHIAPKTPIVGYSGGQDRKVYVKDVTGNQELYLLDQDYQSHYPASTSKLMTALLICERGSLTDTVVLTTADCTDPFGGSSSAGFSAGDTTTFEGLLYAIFLPSSFEACQCAARIIGHEQYVAAGNTGLDGMARFVQMMNNKASALGMSNTNYTNPVGISQHGSTVENVMSAKDCAIVAVAAFGHSICRTASTQPTYSLPISAGPHAPSLSLTNYNRFINGPTNNQQGISDSTVLGGKNGTWTSGGDHYNLAQLVTTPSGHEVIIVVYHSESLYALTLDVQGIMYSIVRDFPYLGTPGYDPNDPAWTDVKVLIGADGSIVDESTVGRSLAVTSVTVGDPVIATTGGMVFNARTDNVAAADASDLEFGSGDATVEVFWFGSGETSPPESTFFAKADHTGSARREWLVEFYANQLELFVNSSGTGWTNSVVAFNLTAAESAVFFNGAPRHIAMAKSGSTWSLYINGELGTSQITGVAAAADTTVEATVGYKYGTGFAALGNYDEYRITNGNARYTNYKHTIDPRKFPRHTGGDVSASNSLNMTDAAHVNITSNHSVTHILSFTQQGARTTLVSGSSTLSLSQTVAVQKVRYVSANNALALTQTVARSLTLNRTATQGLPMTQSAVRSMSYARAVTQPLALTQGDTGIASKLAHNTLTLSQSATYTYSHGARHFLELTQLGSRNMTYVKSLHDFLGVFQRLSVNGLFNKAVSQTLPLTQHVVVTNTKSVKQTLNLTDLAVGITVHAASSTLALSQSVAISKTSNLSASSQLVLLQAAPIQKSKAVSAFHAFGMNQFARGTKVLHAAASNTLVLSQELVQRHFPESVTQNLVLTQQAVCHKISSPSVQQTLTLTQAVVLSKTIVRSLTDTLVFKNSFQKYIGVIGQPYVSVPVVQGVLIKKKCILTLEAPGQSIVLPCPIFGDGEAGTGRLNVKRSMDGTRRIYRRDSPTSKLKYDFVMDRKKAIELRTFIMNNNSNLLRMVNHKGEVWYVLLVGSPFTFTEQAFWDSAWGNKSTITLELEGTRVN